MGRRVLVASADGSVGMLFVVVVVVAVAGLSGSSRTR